MKKKKKFVEWAYYFFFVRFFFLPLYLLLMCVCKGPTERVSVAISEKMKIANAREPLKCSRHHSRREYGLVNDARRECHCGISAAASL